MPWRMHSRRNSDSLSCSFFSAWLRVTYWTALPDVPCRRRWRQRRRVAGRHGAHAWLAHGCRRPARHPSGGQGQGTGAPRAPYRAAAQRPLTFFFFSMLVSLASYRPAQPAALQAAAPLRAPLLSRAYSSAPRSWLAAQLRSERNEGRLRQHACKRQGRQRQRGAAARSGCWAAQQQRVGAPAATCTPHHTRATLGGSSLTSLGSLHARAHLRTRLARSRTAAAGAPPVPAL